MTEPEKSEPQWSAKNYASNLQYRLHASNEPTEWRTTEPKTLKNANIKVSFSYRDPASEAVEFTISDLISIRDALTDAIERAQEVEQKMATEAGQ